MLVRFVRRDVARVAQHESMCWILLGMREEASAAVDLVPAAIT